MAETIGSAPLVTTSISPSEQNATSAESQSQAVAEAKDAQMADFQTEAMAEAVILTEEEEIAMTVVVDVITVAIATEVEVSVETEAIVTVDEVPVETGVVETVDEVSVETVEIVTVDEVSAETEVIAMAAKIRIEGEMTDVTPVAVVKAEAVVMILRMSDTEKHEGSAQDMPTIEGHNQFALDVIKAKIETIEVKARDSRITLS